MNEEEKQDLERTKEDIVNLENKLTDIEREKEEEKDKTVEIPPHSHKEDRIEYKDLQGGIPTISATPTHVAEQGKMLVHDTNDVLYVKVGTSWKAIAAAAGAVGEANTASNQGAAGVGVYYQKSGVDLQFKNVNAGSNKITVTDDVGNHEIDIDVDESNISHDSIGNVSIDDHHARDHASTHSDGGADEIKVENLGATSVDTSKFFQPDGAGGIQVAVPAGTGEVNTASNVGTAGVGVFKQKTGVDLEFKKINAGSSKITITDDTGNDEVDIDAASASTTQVGAVELATAAETTTGTDATRAVTPDGLAGSKFGERALQAAVINFENDITTGDGKFYFHIDSRLDGMDLVDVHAEVITAGTTNTTDIQIHNETDGVDMLSTKLTIDSGETGSDTAATPAVIDTTKDDVVENDLLRVDVDAVSLAEPKGLLVTLGFRLP